MAQVQSVALEAFTILSVMALCHIFLQDSTQAVRESKKLKSVIFNKQYQYIRKYFKCSYFSYYILRTTS